MFDSGSPVGAVVWPVLGEESHPLQGLGGKQYVRWEGVKDPDVDDPPWQVLIVSASQRGNRLKFGGAGALCF